MVDSFDPEVNYFDMAIPDDFPTGGFFQPGGELFQHGDSDMAISLLVESSNSEVDYSNIAISIGRFPTGGFFQPGGRLFQHDNSDMVISLLVEFSNPEVDFSNMAILTW